MEGVGREVVKMARGKRQRWQKKRLRCGGRMAMSSQGEPKQGGGFIIYECQDDEIGAVSLLIQVVMRSGLGSDYTVMLSGCVRVVGERREPSGFQCQINHMS